MSRVPLIDVSPLRSGSATAAAAVAHAIGRAARDIGFFAVVNHGVPETTLAAAFAQARNFFALPDDVKARVSIENSPYYLGFARIASERLDPARPGDAKESFNIGRERPDDDPELLAGAPFVGRNQWPDLAGFRAGLLDYYDALVPVGAALHRAIAIDRGIDASYFTGAFARPLSALRVLHYPPHPGVFDETQYGAGPHTDYGSITLLAQDDAGGLEVRTREGEWLAVEPVPGTLVCNIGDALMRWTNDTYVSNPHRVVNRSGRERYSIAFFCEPNTDAAIACIPACTGPDHPAKYPPVTFADFLRGKLEPTYAR